MTLEGMTPTRIGVMGCLFILASLVPPAQALRIAASPDVVNLNPTGEAALRLFNPNDEAVRYTLEGERFLKQEGVLESSSFADVVIQNGRFFGEGSLLISYQRTQGSNHVELRPALQLRVVRRGFASLSLLPFLLFMFLLFLFAGGLVIWLL